MTETHVFHEYGALVTAPVAVFERRDETSWVEAK
jgi:hypothetical protein